MMVVSKPIVIINDQSVFDVTDITDAGRQLLFTFICKNRQQILYIVEIP